MTKITPVILSGGSGSRLWPLSRQDYPKQLLPLVSEDTLLQQTALRFANRSVYAEPVVICNQAHRFAIAEQLREAGIKAQIMLEPCGKNTAPAATVAAHYLKEKAPDSLMLLVSSDHVITQESAFHQAVTAGTIAASEGWLVTLGIKPTAPETGYGYIESGDTIGTSGVHAVKSFVEKPDKATAERYLASNTYLWNAGLFLFRPDRWLEELGKYHPAMVTGCATALQKAEHDLDFIRLDAEAFATLQGDSIDYAVMEKTTRAAVVPAEAMGWSDVGSWKALWEVSPQRDSNNNVLTGEVLLAANAAGNYVRTDNKQLVALVGVENLVVVVTRDAVLVSTQDKTQDVKKIVEQLQATGRKEAIHHPLVYRPWGSYESIDEGERYQVKRIVVKPGQKLSLQKHFHRAEHWVVVKGTAIVTRNDEQILLQENESVYLPLGAVHRLENPGRIPLVLVEVQSGSYLGEDDIVRLQDTYGRVG